MRESIAKDSLEILDQTIARIATRNVKLKSIKYRLIWRICVYSETKKQFTLQTLTLQKVQKLSDSLKFTYLSQFEQ